MRAQGQDREESVTHVDDPREAAITRVENDSESQRSGWWADGGVGEGAGHRLGTGYDL